MGTKQTLQSAEKELRKQEGRLLEAVLGQADELAKKRKYEGLCGWEALYKIFAVDHHWLPSQVRGLTLEEIGILLPDK